MAKMRKRLITKTIRAGIVAETNVYWHYEWVEEVAGGQWIGIARAWQNRCIQTLQEYLQSIWIYRIKPTKLHLPSEVCDELENRDDWFEYLSGMPEDEAEATTRWCAMKTDSKMIGFASADVEFMRHGLDFIKDAAIAHANPEDPAMEEWEPVFDVADELARLVEEMEVRDETD